MSQVNFHGVTLAREGAVAVIEFSRPPHNFFDLELVRGIADALEAVDAEPGLRSVVLTSTGKTFCAGASFGAGKIDPEPIYREALRIYAARKPIVVAVQGAAIGGGLGLALAGDFRVVSPDSRFAANFVSLGIHPGFGLTVTLPRLVGVQVASRLFLTGRRVKGEEALALGLADMLAPTDVLRQSAIGFAEEIAEGAPLAVQATRETLRQGLVDAITQALGREIAEQRRLFETKDFEEGVRAVGERRPGRWQAA